MTQIQKKQIIKANLQKECGRDWRYWYREFNMIIEAIKLYKEVKARVIITREFIEFQFDKGGGRMEIDYILARQLMFYTQK